MAIETERLLLRKMTYDDFHALYQGAYEKKSVKNQSTVVE